MLKKIIALVIALCLFVPMIALACEETIIPLPKTTVKGTEQLNGCAWFAIDETKHIAGKWDASAREEILCATTIENPFILGLLDNGVVRAKGEVKYTEIDGWVLGLTKLFCSMDIDAEYWELVSENVKYWTGKDEVTQATVIAATQRRTATTIYHVFFLPETPKIPVITLWLNGGKSAVTIYAGIFEGEMALGFVTGGIPYQPTETTEEPEPETTPEPIVNTVYVRETVVREVVKETVKEPTCVRVIQNNYQTIVNSTVTNTQKVILNSTISGGCKKVIPENCVKD